MRNYERVSEVGKVRESQERRERNRNESAALLAHNNIIFEVKNHGAHLVIRHNGMIADLWPGTGLWRIRGAVTGVEGRGIFRMLGRMGVRDVKRLRPDTNRKVPSYESN